MTLTTYRLNRPDTDRLLFLFHGWSAEQHHLAAYVPLVDPDERFTAICPRAIHDLPGSDGASWYDRTADGPDATSFLHAVDTVAAFVDAEMTAAGTTPDRCVVGGFSQGGFMALSLALRTGAHRWAGVWAMCCALPEVEGLELDPAPGTGTRALVQVGERDTIIPPDRGRAAAADLTAAGWDVTVAGYDMGHSQRIEMMADARTWLATV
ncbi:MAG: alpha/beta hydrolase [Ilumatobacteraceae bacterium]